MSAFFSAVFSACSLFCSPFLQAVISAVFSGLFCSLFSNFLQRSHVCMAPLFIRCRLLECERYACPPVYPLPLAVYSLRGCLSFSQSLLHIRPAFFLISSSCFCRISGFYRISLLFISCFLFAVVLLPSLPESAKGPAKISTQCGN